MNEVKLNRDGWQVFGDGRRPRAPSGAEKRPAKISGWREDRQRSNMVFGVAVREGTRPMSISVWQRGGIFAMSTVENSEYPDGKGDCGPHWHLSISCRGDEEGKTLRPTDAQLAQVLACFDLVGADEDNHQSGVARHMWQPIDPFRRRACACKDNERQIVEPDGYTWSAVDGDTSCCEVAKMRGVECPAHPKAPA